LDLLSSDAPELPDVPPATDEDAAAEDDVDAVEGTPDTDDSDE
jgi:hypothetical protein